MDDKFYTDQDPVIRLRVWALGQMIWGGFLAAGVVVGIGAVLLVIWIISMLLPEQSKQAPSPYVTLQIAQTVQVA